MKKQSLISLKSFSLSVSAALAGIAIPAHAATFYWDGTTTSPNADGGNGTWDNGSATNWCTLATGGTNTVWTNANNDTADFGATAGTVTLGAPITVGGLQFDVAGYLVQSSTLTFGASGNIVTNANATINSAIAAGSAITITKTGTGTLTLGGSNTYAGPTTISAGTLTAGGASAFSANSTFTVTGGVLDLNGFNATVAALGAGNSAGTITNSAAGSGTSTLTVTTFNVGLASLITDGTAQKTALAINAYSTPNFGNANNTFSGGITIANNARLWQGSISTTLSGATIQKSNFGTGTVTIGNGSSNGQLMLNGGAVYNPIVVNSTTFADGGNAAFRIDGTGVQLYGQLTANLSDINMSSGGTGSVTAFGQLTGSNGLTLKTPGTSFILTLSNTSASINNYQGNTTIGTSTTLVLSGSGVEQIPNGVGKGNVVLSGTLNMGGNSETINGLSGSGIVDGGSGTPTFSVGDNNATGTFSGKIKNTAGTLALTKIGSGTLTLTGTNTYTGATTVSVGTLTLGGTSAFSGSTSSLTVSSGATLDLSADAATNTYSLLATSGTTLLLNGGTLKFDVGTSAADTLAATGTASVTGTNFISLNAIAAPTSGTYTLISAANGLTGAYQFSSLPAGGTYTLANSATNVVLTSAASTGTFNWSGYTSGIWTSFASGTSQWTSDVAGNNTIVGTPGSAAAVVFSSTNASVGNRTTTLGANFSVSTLTVSDPNNVTIGGANTLTAASASGSAFNITAASGTTTINAILVGGTTSTGLTKSGAGTLVLGGSNSYQGGTTLAAGTLNFGNASALGSGTLTFTGNSTLQAGVSGTVANAVAINASTTGAIDTNGNSPTLSANVSGSGALNKIGSGTLTLSGSNSYTGATTISGGTLRLQGAASAQVAGAGSALWLDATKGVTATSGTVTGWADQSGKGGNATGGTTTGPTTTTINGLTALNFNGSSQYLTGTMGGTGTSTSLSIFIVHKDNALSSLSTYLASPGWTAGSTQFLQGAGHFQYTLHDSATQDRTGTASLQTTTPALDEAIDNNGARSFYLNGVSDGSFSDTANVTNNLSTFNIGDWLNGTQQRYLNGSIGEILIFQTALTTAQRQAVESYINSKWFGIGNTSILPTATPLQIASGATLDLFGTSQQVGSLANSGGGGGTVTNNSTTAAIFTVGNDNTNQTFSGTITDGTGGISLVKQGSGTQVISGSNTYTGTTTISTGTLSVANNLALQNSTLVTTGSGNVTLSGGVTTPTFGGLSGASGDLATVISSGYGGVTNLTLNPNSGSVTYGGSIANGAAGMILTKTGSGTQILTGNNTYSGGTTLSAGTINFGNASALGNGTLTFTGNATLQAGVSGTVGNVVVLSGASTTGTMDTNGNNPTLSGIVSGSGALTKIGSGTLTLTGSNSYSGSTTISAGTLQAGGTSALSANSAFSVLTGGTLDLGGFNNTISSLSTTGAGTITNSSGTATLKISTGLPGTAIANLFTGSLALQIFGGGNTTILGNGNSTYSGGTIFGANGSTATRFLGSGSIGTGSPGALTSGLFGTGTITMGLAATDKAQIYCSGGTTINNAIIVNTNIGDGTAGTFRLEPGPLTINGAVNANLADVSFTTWNSTGARQATVTGAISGNSGVQVYAPGAGPLQINLTLNNAGGANSYAGNTTITSSGNNSATLTLGAANQIPNGVGKGNLVMTSASFYSTFNMAGFSDTINGLSGTGVVDGASGTPTFTVGDNNQSSTFSGRILNTSGTLALTKTGSGTLTLAGTNTYTGATTVSLGTLAISGTSALSGSTSSLTVSSGAMLDLTADNATNTYRLLGTGTPLVLNGGTLKFDVGTSTSDLLAVTGTVAVTGTNFIGINPIVAPTSGTYTLISAANGLNGTFQFSALGAGGTYSLATSATNVVLTSAPSTGTTFYWIGAQGPSWTGVTATGTTNWSSDTTGTNNYSYSTPATVADVIFSSTNASVGNRTTTLGANFSVNTLTVSDTNNVTIGGTNTLTAASASGSAFNITAASGTTTINAILAGGTPSTGLAMSGGGVLVLGGSNTYTGATTINSGTLQVGAGTDSGSIASTSSVADNGALVFNVGAGNRTLSSVISGSGTLSQNSTGTLTLTGSNTYTGMTTINSGTLQANNAAALGNGGNITFGGGTLQYTGASAGQDWSGRFKNSTSGAISLDTNGQTVTLSGTIDSSNTGGLVKIGFGTLALSASNTYTGATTVNAGTLQANNAAALGNGGNITFGGGTLQYTIASAGQDWSGRFKNSTSGAISLDTNGQTVTLSGTIDSSNTGGLVKIGSGTLALFASNTYTGATTVNAGTLQANNAAALGNGGNITFGGGTLQYTIASAGQDWSARFKNSTSGAISLDTNGQTVTLLGNIDSSNTGGLLTSGSGMLTLTGSNTYSGTTTVSSGTLQIGNSGTTGSIASTSGVSLSTGSATLAFSRTDNYGGSFSKPISGSGSVLLNSGSLTLTGSNTYNGATTVAAGAALQVGDGVTGAMASTVTLNGASTLGINLPNGGTFSGGISMGSGTVNLTSSGTNTISGQISGYAGGALNQNGTGTTILSYTNPFLGTANVNAGALQLSSQNAAYQAAVNVGSSGLLTFGANAVNVAALSGSGGVVLQNGTNGMTLTVGGNNQSTTFAGTVSGTNGALTKIGTGTLTLNGTNTYTGNTTVTTGTLQVSGSGLLGSGSYAGTVAISSGALFEYSSSASGTFSGVVSGAGGLTKDTSSTSTLTLSGSNSYSGGTTIGSGTLMLGNAFALGGTNAALAVNGGTLDLFGNSPTVGTLSGNSGAAITTSSNAAVTLTVNQNANATYAGSIQNGNGTVALTKIGTGTLTLSGSNSYSGATQVNGGLLIFSSSNAKASGTATTVAAGSIGLGVGAASGGYSSANVAALFNTNTLSGFNLDPGSGVALDTTGGNFTQTVVLTGSRALTKVGSNTLTLSGTNTYSGATTITSGTLQAGSATALSGSSAFSVAAGATLDLGGFNNTIKSLSTATGTITSTGTATLTITTMATTAQLFTGNLALQYSTNQLNTTHLTNTANTFSGGLTIGGGGGNNRLYLGGGTIGAGTPGALTSGIWGTGAVTLGLNAGDYAQLLFANPTTINNAIVVNSALGNTDVSGAFRTDTTGNILNGTINANMAAATFRNGGGGPGGITLTGLVSGSSGLTLSTGGGPLTVTLTNTTGTNSYAGDTSINSATVLMLGASDQIPNGAGKGNLIVTSGTFNMNGFNETVNGLSGNGTVDGGSGTPTLTVGDNNATGTFSGKILNTSGTLGLTKIGTGTLTLSGTNTYAGATQVNGGLLIFSSTNAKAAGTATTVAAATIGLGVGAVSGGFSDANVAALFNTNTLSGFNLVAGSGVALDTTGGNFTQTIGLTGARALTKLGSNTLTLSGSNNYTGNTTISAGTFKAGGSSALTTSGTFSIATGATLDLGGFNNTILALSSSTGTITDSSATGSGGTLKIATALSGGATSQLFTGSLGLQIYGGNAGSTILSNAANTYSGGTILGNGSGTTLTRWLGYGVIGTLTSGTVSSGIFGTGAITIGAATTDRSQLYFSGGATVNNAIVVNSSQGDGVALGAFRVESGGVAIAGTVNANLADVMFETTNATGRAATVTGAISGLSGLQVYAQTSGTLFIGGLTLTLNSAGNANSYAGNTTISGNGNATLTLGAADQIPNGAGKGNLIVTSGIFKMAGFSETINGLSGNGIVDGANGTPTLTVGDNDATGTGNTFSGRIINTSGTLALTKIGAGTLILSGSNSYSGGTTVSNGTLQVGNTNALGTGGLTVNGGSLDLSGNSVSVGALSGAGGAVTNSVSGTSTLTTTVVSGTSSYDGNIANGTGAVALTKSGSGTLILGGSLTMAGLNASGGATQLVQSGSIGAVNVGAGATVSLAAHTGSVYNVLDISSLTLSGSTSSLAVANDAPAPSYTPVVAASQPNAGVLTDTGVALVQAATTSASEPAAPEAVPEPGTWGLLTAGLSLLISGRRLRRRTSTRFWGICT